MKYISEFTKLKGSERIFFFIVFTTVTSFLFGLSWAVLKELNILPFVTEVLKIKAISSGVVLGASLLVYAMTSADSR